MTSVYFKSQEARNVLCDKIQHLRTALYWAITQRLVVIPHRRFGTTYPSHLQGSRIQESNYQHERSCLLLWAETSNHAN